MTVKLVHLFVHAVPILSHCNEDEQSLLLRLKQSLVYKSSASPGLESWNSSIDCCFWDGVTCTGGHVVALDISGLSFSRGIVNSSSLFELQYLQSLKYAGNGFHLSQIPSAIGKLTNLRYLNLSSNAFFGQVPIEISCLTSLVILDISGDYGGRLILENPNLSMLVQNLPKLTELYLDGVNISSQGTNWCQAISSSLQNLRVLSMSRCHLLGPIDQSLAKLSSLSVIRLDSNDIVAPVPGFLANFSNLTFLSLSFCGLRGTFPKEIFQVSTLQTIDLSDNRELQGSFPEFPQNDLFSFWF